MTAPAADVRARGRCGRGLLTLVLVAAFAASVVALPAGDMALHRAGWDALRELAASLVRPDLSPAFLVTVAEAAALTVAYAVTAMTLAVLIGLPAGVLASGVLAARRRTRIASTVGVRAVLAVLRAMDELVWALLFVTVFGLSPVAGVLAIALPYGATIGRVVAERLQDVPPAPLNALRATGASPLQMLAYGRAPIVGADVLAYLFYRLECAVRAAAVLSFVGLGGIGFQITVALDDLRFERVWTLLLALVLLVAALDRVSARIRTRLVV